jgi:HPt (histidine-containing phosphotransfer) domain-containing protein
VAHIGQKLALGTVGGFGFLAGLFKLNGTLFNQFFQLLACLKKYLWQTADEATLDANPPDQSLPQAAITLESVAVYQDISDLIPIFLENTLKQVVLAQESLAKSDWASLARIGHSLKGAGASFGFQLISDQAIRLETLSMKQDQSALQVLLQEMDAYLRHVKWHVI